MGNATIISVVPFAISEFKPGIYPGTFDIPASKNGVPEILVIGDSVYHVEIDENRTITVKCQAVDVAKAICDDYIISNLAYSEEANAAPGLFWADGVYDTTRIYAQLNKHLEETRERQKQWFIRLVRLADDDWEKTRQHKFISDMQRYAAKSLQLERPWIINPKEDRAAEMKKCTACGQLVDKEAVVCPFCRLVLDLDKWKTMKFAEVKV